MTPKGRKFWTEVAAFERVIVECLLLAREAIVHIDHRLSGALQYKRTYYSPTSSSTCRGRRPRRSTSTAT